jgi:hypothetical protein
VRHRPGSEMPSFAGPSSTLPSRFANMTRKMSLSRKPSTMTLAGLFHRSNHSVGDLLSRKPSNIGDVVSLAVPTDEIEDCLGRITSPPPQRKIGRMRSLVKKVLGGRP